MSPRFQTLVISLVAIGLGFGCGESDRVPETPGPIPIPGTGTFVAETDPPTQTVQLDAIVDPASTLSPAVLSIDGYNTIMADSTTAFQFSGTPGDPTVIVTGSPPVIAVGDVVGGVSNDGLRGLLRLVTAINGSVLSTVPTTIEKAFPNSFVSLQLRVSDSAPTTTAFNGPSGRTPLTSLVPTLTFDRHVEHEFAPGISGVVDFSMSSTFDATINFNSLAGEIDSFSASVDTQINTTAFLNVDSNVQFRESFSTNFNPVFDANVVAQIGLLPVLVNIKMIPTLGADIDLSGATTLKYGYQANADIEGGFTFDGSSISNQADVNPSLNKLDPSFTLAGGVEVGAQAGMSIVVSIYEAEIDIPVLGKFTIDGPGLGLSAGPNAKFTASSLFDVNGDPMLICNQNLQVGFASHLDVDYGGLGTLIGAANPGPIEIFELSSSLFQSSECPYSGTGSLQGIVADIGGFSLPNVTITAVGADQSLAGTVSSDSSGFFSFQALGVGTYELNFALAGFETAMATTLVTEDMTTTTSQILILDELDPDAVGMLNASVVDAQDPTLNILGAQLLFREGLNAPTGAFVAQVISSGPVTNVTLPAGYYTLNVSADDYASTSTSFTLPDDQTISVSLALSRISPAAGGDARIVLTWGLNPSDLDSHLLSPVGHVFFGTPTAPGINLDVDDVTSFGPETISIDNVDLGATYRYFVHRFSGTGSLATSNATVRLFYEGTERIFPVVPGSGDFWHVFDINNGFVTGCNGSCITSSQPQLPSTGLILNSLPTKIEKTGLDF
ncbi:MAG: hypothetical protein ACI8TQ_000402 [Planctomycetota bacterium]|jgi:hypothetical protein